APTGALGQRVSHPLVATIPRGETYGSHRGRKGVPTTSGLPREQTLCGRPLDENGDPMSTITQSRRGSAAAMAAVLAGVAVVAPPAGAASPHEYNAGYREKVAMAGAIWNAATDTTTTVMELQVYELTSQRIPARPD